MQINVFPSKDYIIESLPCKKEYNTGILIQGPIITKNNFTLKTVELYNELFSNPIIALSTWEDQPTEDFESLKLSNLIIIKNKNIEKIGPDNTNKMILTIQEGIKTLKQRGVRFLIRTRADHRIIAENCEEFLYELLHYFPLNSIDNQLYRIITLNFFTLSYIPFHISDMFQFGNINDLEEYWDAKHINQIYAAKFNNIKKIKVAEFDKYALSEIYLGIEYAKRKMGADYQYNLSSYWQMLKDRFIIIDNYMLGLICTNMTGDIFTFRNDIQGKLRKPFTFKDWFLLQSNLIDIDLFSKKYDYKLNFYRDIIDKSVGIDL